MVKNLKQILGLLDSQGIEEVTFKAHKFEEEYNLSCDDKDWVTFHKSPTPPFIIDKLMVCDTETTETPVCKGWYMTINYHS